MAFDPVGERKLHVEENELAQYVLATDVQEVIDDYTAEDARDVRVSGLVIEGLKKRAGVTIRDAFVLGSVYRSIMDRRLRSLSEIGQFLEQDDIEITREIEKIAEQYSGSGQ